jgi:hypothetical protein
MSQSIPFLVLEKEGFRLNPEAEDFLLNLPENIELGFNFLNKALFRLLENTGPEKVIL